MQTSLETILEKKKKEMDTQAPKWKQRREEWVSKISRLYSLIEKWLEPLKKQKYLDTSLSETLISEEYLGSYSAPTMTISFFNNHKVTLKPKGLYVIGAEGRIDMVVGDRIVMLVGVGDNLDWSFAEREGRGQPRRWDFTEENFLDILTSYAEEF